MIRQNHRLPAGVDRRLSETAQSEVSAKLPKPRARGDYFIMEKKLTVRGVRGDDIPLGDPQSEPGQPVPSPHPLSLECMFCPPFAPVWVISKDAASRQLCVAQTILMVYVTEPLVQASV